MPCTETPDAAVKAQPDPRRVLAGAQRVGLALNLERGALGIVGVSDPERNAHRAAAFDERILRTFQLAFDGVRRRARSG